MTAWIPNNPKSKLGLGKDHIHVINQKCAKFNEPLYMAFIAYEKAFDSVSAVAVLEASKDHVIEGTYIRLLDYICEGCAGRITSQKKHEKFPSRKEV